METIRHSRLCRMAKSPMHFKSWAETPATGTQELGTAVHKMVLLGMDTVVSFDGRRDKRTKAYQDFLETAGGAMVLLPAQYEQAKQMAAAVLSHPLASSLLARAPAREQLVVTTLGDLPVRATPDAYGDEFILELKTTKDASPSWFWTEARRYWYHTQAEWYRQVLRAAGGGQRRHYTIAVENGGVPAVTVFEYTESQLEQARRSIRLWLEQLHTCLEADEWPPYAMGVCPLEWGQPEIEALDEEESEEALA